MTYSGRCGLCNREGVRHDSDLTHKPLLPDDDTAVERLATALTGGALVTALKRKQARATIAALREGGQR